jgi:cytochrome c553
MPIMKTNVRTLLRPLFAALLLATSLSTQAQQPPRLELCVACHGPQGNSVIPMFPSLAGQPRIFMENQLVLIREGLRDIPSMKGVLDGLDDPALIELAKYFAAQKPAPMPGVVDVARYQRGKDLAAGSLCGSCHLPSYQGRDQIPRLAGQHEAFMRTVMEEYRDKPGPGRDTVMTNALRGFSNEQLDDMAHFLAHFGKQP